MMSKKSFASYLSLSTLMATLLLSTTLVSDTGSADSISVSASSSPTATTITSNATAAANAAATRTDNTKTDLTRTQLLNALLGYDASLIIQNAAVQPPGDPAPSSDSSQPQPPYTKIATVEADRDATLSNQILDENIFYLYGVSKIEPKELASVPLKTGYLSKHFSAYCTPLSSDETNAYVCNNSATSALQHADIKPLSLLGPMRYDGPGGMAALEYIRSTVDPWASHNIKSAMTDTSDTGNQDTIINALARQSKLNVPVYSMLSAYARRMPSANNPDNKTFMETLDYEIAQRYPSTAWHKNIATAPTEALLKDIAAMMALSLWIQKEQFKQNERLELLMSMNVLGSIAGEDQVKASQSQGNQAASSANTAATQQNSPSN
jgi:hypothetical protein